jgi:hypothetical protein
MNVKTVFLLSALATVCFGLLFVVIGLWMPGTLLKPEDYTLERLATDRHNE